MIAHSRIFRVALSLAILLIFITITSTGCGNSDRNRTQTQTQTQTQQQPTGYQTSIVFCPDTGFPSINSYTTDGWQIVSSRRAYTGNLGSGFEQWGTEYTLQKPIYQ